MEANNMKMTGSLLVSTALYVLLCLPSMRGLLESNMVGHAVVQLALLVTVGLIWARCLKGGLEVHFKRYDPSGIASVFTALFALGFWMLPRSLDLALESSAMEMAKFIMLPLMVGLPLRYCWYRFRLPGRGFLMVNLLPMAAVLGWAYLSTPTRLCSNYLINEQKTLGLTLLAIAIGVPLVFLLKFLFIPQHNPQRRALGLTPYGAIINWRE